MIEFEVLKNQLQKKLSPYYILNTLGFTIIGLILIGSALYMAFAQFVLKQNLDFKNPIIAFSVYIIILTIGTLIIKWGTLSFRKEEYRNEFFLPHAKTTTMLFLFLITLIICQALTNSRENYSSLLTIPLFLLLTGIQGITFITGLVKKQQLDNIAKIILNLIIFGTIIGIIIELLAMISIVIL